MKFDPSEEQLCIFQHIQEGKNVIVDAIAGAGKSTTILSIAERMKETKFLQITYNSMLRKEFKEKLEHLCIKNIEVHTFHSFAVKYFYSSAFTDTGIREILYEQMPPQHPIPNFDVVVLDECQDMTPLYYHFIKYVFDLFPKNVIQLLILGDYMQGLYEFKGADIRFLTMADQIWSSCPCLKTNEFIRCSLKMSYRITNQMADFINVAMLDEQRLHACREGAPVVYIRNTRTNIEKIVIYHIKKILEEGDLPSDIFILGSSVRGVYSNIRKMENTLVESGIPCHVPMLEADKIDDRVIDGKVVFSTFHTVKGRQRKYVFVLGFDSSYFQIYSRGTPTDVCPNTLYVACTRATHKLFVLESAQYATDKPLPFLKLTHHDMIQKDFIDFKGNPQSIFWERSSLESVKEKPTIYQINATDLIRFIPEPTIEILTPLLNKIYHIQNLFEVEGSYPIRETDIPSIVKFQNGLYEDVSDLNGIAIPCMYYDMICDQANTTLYKLITMHMKDLKSNEYPYLKSIYDQLTTYCESVAEYLYMSNVFISFQERLYFKLRQIDMSEYTWISDELMERVKLAMDSVIGDTSDLKQEETIIDYSMETEHVAIDRSLESSQIRMSGGDNIKYRFKARIDLISKDTVWELKCTSQLSLDHMLQLVLYAWLWKILYPEQEKRFRLFNIKTGECTELIASIEELTEIVVLLIKGKYEKPKPVDDALFLATVL
jgi:AAA domain